MKTKSKEQIKDKFFSMIEEWAESDFQSAEAWASRDKDHQNNIISKNKFIKEKKKEIEKFLDAALGDP